MSRVLIVSAALTIAAVAAFAQLSAKYADFARGPEQWIMTADEQAKWKQVKTDAEAQAFVDLFWARRDPTPGTPVNEYRDEFDARAKYGDDHFAEGRRRGSLTDRGRFLVLLGAPSRIERSGAAPAGMPDSTRGSSEQPVPKQVWVYDTAKIPAGISNRISFVDQFGNGTWSLERGTGLDITDLTSRVLTATIVSPALTEAPKPRPAAARQQPPVTPPAPPAPASLMAFKTETLKTAVESYKPNQFKSADISYTELLSPAGDYFGPLQLYVPKSTGLTADQMTTFFGRFTDGTGATAAIFEEPASLAGSGGDLYFDKSITTLKPGTYTATVGLADKSGNPVVLTSQKVELKPLSKDETAVSRLVLSRDVHQTDAAAPAGAPYAFGRVKIVPKGDHVFTNKDEITYFVEVINPGLAAAETPAVESKTTQTPPATSVTVTKPVTETTPALLPKIQVKLELIGTGTKDKPGRTITAPIADAAPLPLTGTPGPGQYAIMAGIPLGDMKTPLPAGDYTLRVKVYDQVKKQSWTAEQPLKLVNVPAAPPATTTAK